MTQRLRQRPVAAQVRDLVTPAVRPELSPVARFLALLIATYANADGWAYPSAGELVEVTGRSPSAIRAATLELERDGVLERVFAERGKRPGSPAVIGYEFHTVGDIAAASQVIPHSHLSDSPQSLSDSPQSLSDSPQSLSDSPQSLTFPYCLKNHKKKLLEETASTHAPSERGTEGAADTAAEVWAAALSRLREQVTRPSFDTWLRDSRGAAIEGGALVVEVPAAFVAEWLQARMQGLAETAVASSQPLAVVFRVASSSGAGRG